MVGRKQEPCEYKNQESGFLQSNGKTFSPKKSSKVCELHFKESDFKVEASAFDSKNGILISAPLQVRRLKENTVPSIFKDYPSVYSSKSSTIVREDPDAKKKTARECHNLQKALRESLKEYEMYNNDLKINCSNDILSCIDRYGISAFWHVYTVPDTSTVCFIHIVFSPGPSIDYSVVVNDNQEMSEFIKEKSIMQLSPYTFPHKVTNFNEIRTVLDKLANLQTKESDA
ncbi:uncharacterized protein LOC118193383 [Stegodyphus dumicola]|uniref:uncharacterized protein LOC118193383 n=1 Tax=Stegodyphus dumicola TaxID=202533 RepID=UPI0015B1DF8E|nr:uncharacterized protein LOC118193383 [Stegodyphus dumicola]